MCLERKVVEKIRYFLEWGCGTLCGDHQVGSCGFAATVLTLAAAFILGFPIDGLGAAVALVSGICGLAVFLVAITLGSSGASLTV